MGLSSRSMYLLVIATAGFATLLVATELVSVAAATIWALSGLLGLNPTIQLVLEGSALLGCAAMIIVFARRAFAAERLQHLVGSDPAAPSTGLTEEIAPPHSQEVAERSGGAQQMH